MVTTEAETRMNRLIASRDTFVSFLSARLRDKATGEYQAAIEAVDLDGIFLEDFRKANDIKANNASVRLHRARKSVAKELIAVCGSCAEHQCLDCTCKKRQL